LQVLDQVVIQVTTVKQLQLPSKCQRELRLNRAEIYKLVIILTTACARSPHQRASSLPTQEPVQLVMEETEVSRVARLCIPQSGSAWTRQVMQRAIRIYRSTHLLTYAIQLVGNLYISDHRHFRIRKVAASTNVISTIAGTGTASYSGDNGQATSATLNYPSGVAVDTSGKRFQR
jgi:hypothetical protein